MNLAREPEQQLHRHERIHAERIGWSVDINILDGHGQRPSKPPCEQVCHHRSRFGQHRDPLKLRPCTVHLLGGRADVVTLELHAVQVAEHGRAHPAVILQDATAPDECGRCQGSEDLGLPGRLWVIEAWVACIFEKEVQVALPYHLVVDVGHVHILRHLEPFSYVADAVDDPEIDRGATLALSLPKACKGV